ncbi:hypothetical protein OS493_039184 [Desmophyllum pertusum]|uniref:Uncharacterized protein n=1 Tax=Desmophyllum pertusum TaxID=174260 RepID=A0A9W9Z697_9CNID|nr:hypothetical protein OS493_039184 [Desmophyllum pertusum]
MLLKRVPKGEADEADHDQMTSLHWSVSYGNAEHVKLLLKAGSTVTLTDMEIEDIPDKEGRDCSHLRLRGKRQVKNAPKDDAEHNLDVHDDSSGTTPIMVDHQDVTQYMIEQGALTINGIQDIASTNHPEVLAWLRKCARHLKPKKTLLMRHEAVRRETNVQAQRSRKRLGTCLGTQSLLAQCISKYPRTIENLAFLIADLSLNRESEKNEFIIDGRTDTFRKMAAVLTRAKCMRLETKPLKEADSTETLVANLLQESRDHSAERP